MTLDHIVIAADSLEQGVAYLHDKLGVTVPFGGEHPLMGTHNCLMQLSANSFLEIIAINPNKPAPVRPRWFGLDNPYTQAALKVRPRVLTYLINTEDIDKDIDKATLVGEKVQQQRGDLRWHITIPKDGSLPAAGLVPMLIQWKEPIHPAAKMPDLGCRLESLRLHTPYPAWLRTQLDTLDTLDITADWLHIQQSEEVRLELVLHTPDKGLVRL